MGKLTTGPVDQIGDLLQHSASLLRTDTDRSLWNPLVESLLYGVSDRLEELGRLELVSRSLDAVALWLDALPPKESAEPSWLHHHCVLTVDRGDLLQAQGDLSGALAAYRESLALSRRLAEADPSNAVWQRDLSVSLTKLAQFFERIGDRAAAHDHAVESLAIDERLSALDPSNAVWQKDVAITRTLVARLGDSALRK